GECCSFCVCPLPVAVRGCWMALLVSVPVRGGGQVPSRSRHCERMKLILRSCKVDFSFSLRRPFTNQSIHSRKICFLEFRFPLLSTFNDFFQTQTGGRERDGGVMK